MQDNRYYSFSTCFRLLEEANEEMKTKLSYDNYCDILKASKKNRKIFFIIDIDLAVDPVLRRIRNQFYEACQLYQQSGGYIVAYTKREEGYFRDGNMHAFTKVFYDMTMDDEEKADFFHQEYTLKHLNDYFLIFADKMTKILKPINCVASINTIGTNFLTFNQEQCPLTKYSLVEYIMLFLGIKMRINDIFEKTLPTRRGECSECGKPIE